MKLALSLTTPTLLGHPGASGCVASCPGLLARATSLGKLSQVSAAQVIRTLDHPPLSLLPFWP